MAKIPAIGIDLGTTNCCVGIWLNGKVEIIPNDLGERVTPSCVSFNGDKINVGDEAKFEMIKNDKNTVYDVKRLIGRKYNDVIVQNDKKLWNFELTEEASTEIPKIKVTYKNETRKYRPEEISSILLQKLRMNACEFLKKEVKDAVITVPAYFNDSQRQSTKDAGTLAGLNVVRIINEPTAAAIAYGLDKLESDKGEKEIKIIVFDFGGGTFDVSLVEMINGIFEVKATSGDTHLGGVDIDNKLTDFCVDLFNKYYNLDLKSNKKSLARLKLACEKAKKELSYSETTNIDINALMNQKDFNVNISRKILEGLCQDILEKMKKPLNDVLKKSKLNKKDIDDIILIGGSTKMPIIIDFVKEYFDGKKPNISINPDEAVAYGAAVHGAFISHIIEKKINNLSLLDVTPLTLGVEIIDHKMDPIIHKNTRFPCSVKKEYSTVEDNQDKIIIKIFEGEDPSTDKCHKLAEFFLHDIPKMKKGVPTINVKFNVDSNSILTVSAEEVSSSNKKSIKIDDDKINIKKSEIEIYKIKNKKLVESGFEKPSKEKKNIKNNIKYYTEEINKTTDMEEKYKLSQNLAKTFKAFINLIDVNLMDTNCAVLEKFVEYTKKLFISYEVTLSSTFIKENEKIEIIDDINRRIDFINNYEIKYLYGLIDVFKNLDIYYVLLIKLMRLYFNKGLKLYEKKIKKSALYFFKEIESFSYKVKKKINFIDYSDKTEHDDILESTHFYIKRIKISQLINDGDKYFEKGVFNNESIDMDSIYLSLDKYNEAYNILLTKSDKSNEIDIEYEAICLSKLVKIMYKILKNKEVKDIYKLAMQSVNLALSLHPKNVSNEKWYIDIATITQEIRNQIEKTEELSIQSLNNLIIEANKRIFDEIQNKYDNESEIKFISFCLNKHPPKDYEKLSDEEIKKKYDEDKKNFLRKLSAQYHPNRYENNSNEEKRIYLIMEEIYKKINNLNEEIEIFNDNCGRTPSNNHI